MRPTRTPDTRRRKLSIEALEDRAVPATFGVPWNDPSHLTLSFAPDGTTIAGHTSSLFQSLNAQQPTAQWERSILLAFQTWAVNANLNIGLVADSGAAFGVAGASQHDGRFGDIRVGAHSMAPDVLSISVPNDPALSSTLTGDVFINKSDNFSSKGLDILGVLLHESGHVLGIGETADSKSPMYAKYLGNTKLTAGDIASLQALYGNRALDRNEGSSGNDTIARASTIQSPGSYTGATPLVAFGDISTAKDADVFAFRAPSGYQGGATIRLQSAGISLLAPHLTILDAQGRVLADGQASTGFGDVVTSTLGTLSPNATYYVKVSGATTDAFGIGSYGLAVSFNATNKVATSAINTVLRGPYQTLGPNDIASIFKSPTLTYFNASHSSDPGTAPTITSSPGFAPNSHYEVIGSIAGPTDSSVYRIKTANAPAGGKPLVLTVTVRSLGVNGTAPRVAIFDGDGRAVAAQVLANGGGMFTVQAVGVKPGGNYLLRVGPATSTGSASSGNFALSAQFATSAAQLSTFASANVSSTTPTRSYTLFAGETQLMHLVLGATATAVPVVPGSAVRLTVLDATGKVLYALTAPAGDVVSGPDLLLLPGSYRFLISAVGAPGGPVPSMNFRLLGEEISDPIGPVINDPTMAPIYTAPGLPGWFQYPGNITTQSAYLFRPTLLA